MINTVDLIIRKEKEALMHQCQAELLPFSTGITLSMAQQALDEGLTESTPNGPLQTPSQALSGASQLDPVIASFTHTILAKINELAETSSAKVDKLSADLNFRLSHLECKNKTLNTAAVSGGGFTSVRQIAHIHKCATNNFISHQLILGPQSFHADHRTMTHPQGWEALKPMHDSTPSAPGHADVMQTQEDFSPTPINTINPMASTSIPCPYSPSDRKIPPFIQGLSSHSHLIFSTSIRLLTTHTFTGEYTARFQLISHDPYHCECRDPLQMAQHILMSCP